ncbi:MAG TPA: hypothetical protein DF296_07035 [Candidatus Margulisbacteria bacterium]|nr:hypothetical protein [Candidatus Margulisiibacteriota bacterium]HCT84940.1 hypothetical protein [Candidatus Margulisiibacteriota bacterium]HCY37737.1 hypothetical protein [Candidatus Margulisiibacteriota bacterium]
MSDIIYSRINYMLKKLLLLIILFFSFSSISFAVIKNDTALASSNVILIGERLGDTLGYNVRIIGDINGDGVADMVVGSPMYNNSGAASAGKIYIVPGDQSWNTATSINALILGCAIASYYGETAGDRLGSEISPAGDVNGDGYSDFFVAAEENGSSGVRAGKVYLIFGKPGGWSQDQSIASADVEFLGERAGDIAGRSVAGLGDFNGDGLADFAVGATKAGSGGKVYVFFGKTGVWQHSYSLSEFPLSFVSEQSNTWFGNSVAGVGDVNGDNFDDLLVSEYLYPLGAGNFSETGKVSLIFGKASGWTANMPVSENVAASYIGEAKNNHLGKVIAPCGDINGDGFNDMIMAAPDYNSFQGKVYLVLGKSSGWERNKPISQIANASWVGESGGDSAGTALSGVGDLNGDGTSEILIGAPRYTSNIMNGKVYIIMGNKAFNLRNNIHLSEADGSFLGDQTMDEGGFSISGGGDVDGDGFDDLLVGAIRAGANHEGGVYANFLYTNEPPKFVDSVAAYVSDNYSSPIITSINVNDTVYIKMVGVDGDPWVTNNATVKVFSGSDPNGIYLELFEPSQDSGVYFGMLRTSSRSSSLQGRRIHVSGGDVITVISLVPSTNTTYPSINVSFLNSPPVVTTVSAFQAGSHVQVNYVIKDTNEDDVCFNSHPSQVQYSLAPGGPWNDAQMTGKVDYVYTDAVSVTHDEIFEPLYWEPGQVSAQYYIRIKPKDMIEFAEKYITSDPVSIDTIPPSAPAFLLPSLVSCNIITINALLSSDASSINYVFLGLSITSLDFVSGTTLTATLNLQEGINIISIAALDDKSNRSVTTSATILLDTVPPLTPTPAFNSVSTSLNWVVVTGSCAFDDHNVGFYTESSMNVQFACYPTSNLWIATMNAIATGLSAISFFTTDVAGNRSATATVSIFVDNIPPAAAVLSAIATLNASTILLAGNANEPDLLVEVYVQDQLIATTQTTVSCNFSFSLLPVSPTRNQVCVILEDKAGNRSSTSNILNLIFEERSLAYVAGAITVTVDVPISALPVEDSLVVSMVSSSVLFSLYNKPPGGQDYVIGMDIYLQNNQQLVALNKPITVSIELNEHINTPHMHLLFREYNSWHDSYYQIISTSNSQMVFLLTKLGRFSMVQTALDTVSPNIGTMYVNDILLVDDDYSGDLPKLTVVVTDNRALQSYTIAIKSRADDSTKTATSNIFLSTVTLNLIVYAPSSPLPDGRYYFELDVKDSAGNSALKRSKNFVVKDNEFVMNILSAPNPWDPTKGDLVFGYNISRRAELKLVIFDLAGNIVKEWSYGLGDPHAEVGYHEITWDGYKAQDKYLKNGLYLGYFIAESDKIVRKQKLKIAIIR